MSFLNWYHDKAVEVVVGDIGWEHLHSAANERKMSVSSLIDGIKEGEITPKWRKDLSEYAALFVRSDDVDAMSARRSG